MVDLQHLAHLLCGLRQSIALLLCNLGVVDGSLPLDDALHHALGLVVLRVHGGQLTGDLHTIHIGRAALLAIFERLRQGAFPCPQRIHLRGVCLLRILNFHCGTSCLNVFHILIIDRKGSGFKPEHGKQGKSLTDRGQDHCRTALPRQDLVGTNAPVETEKGREHHEKSDCFAADVCNAAVLRGRQGGSGR